MIAKDRGSVIALQEEMCLLQILSVRHDNDKEKLWTAGKSMKSFDMQPTRFLSHYRIKKIKIEVGRILRGTLDVRRYQKPMKMTVYLTVRRNKKSEYCFMA